MPIFGGVLLGASERGACGFSNEKSLTYWVMTPIWGIAICGGGLPFVVDMLVSGSRKAARRDWLTQGRGSNNAAARGDESGSCPLCKRPLCIVGVGTAIV